MTIELQSVADVTPVPPPIQTTSLIMTSPHCSSTTPIPPDEITVHDYEMIDQNVEEEEDVTHDEDEDDDFVFRISWKSPGKANGCVKTTKDLLYS